MVRFGRQEPKHVTRTHLWLPSSDSLLAVWLQDAKGFVFEFCRDQHGSRFIQERLAKASAEEVLALYSEVQPRMLSLMTDVFGNYVIQKFLEHGNQVGLLEESCLAVGHPHEQPCAPAWGRPWPSGNPLEWGVVLMPTRKAAAHTRSHQIALAAACPWQLVDCLTLGPFVVLWQWRALASHCSEARWLLGISLQCASQGALMHSARHIAKPVVFCASSLDVCSASMPDSPAGHCLTQLSAAQCASQGHALAAAAHSTQAVVS